MTFALVRVEGSPPQTSTRDSVLAELPDHTIIVLCQYSTSVCSTSMQCPQFPRAQGSRIKQAATSRTARHAVGGERALNASAATGRGRTFGGNRRRARRELPQQACQEACRKQPCLQAISGTVEVGGAASSPAAFPTESPKQFEKTLVSAAKRLGRCVHAAKQTKTASRTGTAVHAARASFQAQR